MKIYLSACLVCLLATACASGPSEADTQPSERPTQTTTEARAAEISEARRAELEPKFCQAAIDLLERTAEGAPPEDCERVIMRPTDQFGGAGSEGYLATVVVGEDRQHVQLGAEVGPGGSIDIRPLESELDQALSGRAEIEIRNLRSAVEAYQIEKGRLPEDLDTLAQQPDALLDEVPRDPWGNAYVYEPSAEARDFELYSAGPDGRAGTADDVQLTD